MEPLPSNLCYIMSLSGGKYGRRNKKVIWRKEI